MWFGDEDFTRDIVLAALRRELKLRQRRNSLYSLRAFARDLGVDSTILNRILHEKRKMTWDFAVQVRDHIGLSTDSKPASDENSNH